MKLFNYLDRYITDDLFRVVLSNNSINIINYIEVIDFSTREISIKYSGGILVIKGSNMLISKMVDDELVIDGCIKSINYK